MQTFDQHLLAMFKAGLITVDEATAAATSPHDFSVMVRQAGLG